MLRLWTKYLLNLIYPLSCVICASRIDPLSETPLCPQCWNKIELIKPPFCRGCGKHLSAYQLEDGPDGSAGEADDAAGIPIEYQDQALFCSDCQKSAYFFKKAHAVCLYDGIIKQCIHLLKYDGRLALQNGLGRLLVDFAREHVAMDTLDVLIPVPLAKSKLRQRQFNQSYILARPLAKAFAKDLRSRALIRRSPTVTQTGLTRKERLRNVRDVFTVSDAAGLKGKRILLIDDVFTTGATANECAKALIKAKAAEVQVLTLAKSR